MPNPSTTKRRCYVTKSALTSAMLGAIPAIGTVMDISMIRGRTTTVYLALDFDPDSGIVKSSVIPVERPLSPPDIMEMIFEVP